MQELSSAEWGMTENIHQKVEVVRSGGKGNGVIGKKQRADQQQQLRRSEMGSLSNLIGP